MLEITLQRGGKRLLKEPVGTSPITVGRAAENTIRLIDPDISREHCRLDWQDDGLCVTDLSRNGILVNGERVRESRVDAGDRITVGPWNLIVEATVDAVPVRTIVAAPHSTRVISFDPARRRLRTQAVELIVRTPDQAPLKKRIAKGEILIGHHGSCDLAVADPYVSRRHCKLVVEEGAVRLVDLASTNGVWMAGMRVAGITMQPQGEFRIGRSTVNYRVVSGTEELKASEAEGLGELVGRSKRMREVYALIERAAPSDATIVVTGESGTGKELVAREIHRLSARRRGPFVAINCGALPANIVEGQLFGHERGAFTGAVERAPGLIEQAAGGTLFLDEIGEMPIELQTRLLRALEQRSVRRVGGQEEVACDFRLVAATNRDLLIMAKEGGFREDLLYRIFVVPIDIAPLRDRPEDIPLLVERFAAQLAPEGRSPVFTKPALRALAEYPWMGNARELKNAVERTILFTDHDAIAPADLALARVDAEGDPKESLQDQEASHIVETLAQCRGNLTQCARRLGISRTTMQKKVKRFGIEVPGRDPPARRSLGEGG